MKVEIWSDIVCPFCYIGKRKFEMALENFEGKEQVEIEWKSFQLDPDMVVVPGQTVHEYLGKRKGTTALEGKNMNDGMTAIAKQVGLDYDFDKAVSFNTMDAHRLLHLGKKLGVQNQLKERLFKAYYTEGKNLGQTETLIQLAKEVGIDPADSGRVLECDEYRTEVLRDQYTSQQVGVQGVPFYVFNDKYAVSGAQAPELFAQVLEKVWGEEKPVLVSEDGVGFCTPEGECTLPAN